eukprot:Tbor_TRINITY_DN3649_c0_g1::TRINITY_DN3649_c0_g1_i1::g.240::m.240
MHRQTFCFVALPSVKSFSSSTVSLDRNSVFAKSLDTQAASKDIRKGPAVANSLPNYKTAHKLNHGVRWKSANLIANVAAGKDYRLSETHGEGTFDETGMYRDWLYGDERRYANYIAIALFSLSCFLFFYTIRIMGSESWEIPAPVIATQRKKLQEDKEGETIQTTVYEDALASLKRPTTVSKMA